MERIDWETVASYLTSMEASVAKARLEDEGTRVFVANSAMADMAWHLNNATGGARVQVPRADVAWEVCSPPPFLGVAYLKRGARPPFTSEELVSSPLKSSDSRNRALLTSDALRVYIYEFQA